MHAFVQHTGLLCSRVISHITGVFQDHVLLVDLDERIGSSSQGLQKVYESRRFSRPTGFDRNLLRHDWLLQLSKQLHSHVQHLRLGSRQEKWNSSISPVFSNLLYTLEIVEEPEVFECDLVVKVKVKMLQHLPTRH